MASTIDLPEFDRSKPLYRLFAMDDGTQEWWTVEADNTPGRRLDDVSIPPSAMVQAIVDRASWRDWFYIAFEKHKKATVYASVATPYEVPEGCDGILRGAWIETWQDRSPPAQVALGYIYGDRKGRFPDGRAIHTSRILSGPDENGIIKTRNSTYKLEMVPQKEGHDVVRPT